MGRPMPTAAHVSTAKSAVAKRNGWTRHVDARMESQDFPEYSCVACSMSGTHACLSCEPVHMSGACSALSWLATAPGYHLTDLALYENPATIYLPNPVEEPSRSFRSQVISRSQGIGSLRTSRARSS